MRDRLNAVIIIRKERRFETYTDVDIERDGAAKRKGGIEQELTQTDTVDIEYSYFIRANGSLHVQCAVHDVSGQISYRYYTLRYSGRQLVGGLGEAGYGQMDSQFSDLEVIY